MTTREKQSAETVASIIDSLTTDQLNALIQLAVLGARHVCGSSSCGDRTCRKYAPYLALTKDIRANTPH